MIISLILLAVFGVVAVGLWREGFWHAAVMLLTVLLAATAATAWYERLAVLIDRQSPSYTYLVDFVMLWALFCGITAALREVTERVWRYKVKLRRPIEMFGTPVVAAVAGWIVMAFTAATLHTAPLPRDTIQPTPEARLLFGLSPDRKWLAWVRGSTRVGPFANPQAPFDPQADFIIRYADRRKKLEAEPELRVAGPPGRL